jgi:hypothetical protein
MLMNEGADIGDGVFEHAVCRGVGDHHAGQLIRIHLNLKKIKKKLFLFVWH